MNLLTSDADVSDALNACAEEAVHTPGRIQPIGNLVACDLETGLIGYASETSAGLFGRPLSEIFGQHVRDLLGSEIWHGLANTQARGGFKGRRVFVGLWVNDGVSYAVHGSSADANLVIEIEDVGEVPQASAEMLHQQTFLLDQIRSCDTQKCLCDLTVRLLRHVTGFDRVMVYKFDPSWHGEVVAEARATFCEPFEGLRFPHWDIPAQARDIMRKIELRLIADVDQKEVLILAASQDLPPLDISFSQSRGASEMHLQYLKNMGTASTMTLSVVVDGDLWGMISFHHTKPRLLPADLRQILTGSFLPVFCLKLGVFRDRDVLRFSEELDAMQSQVQTEIERGAGLSELLETIGPTVCEALDGVGFAIVAEDRIHAYGDTPSKPTIDELIAFAQDAPAQTLAIDQLSTVLSGQNAVGKLAGALVKLHSGGRAVLAFRRETKDLIHWAGSPEKIIEEVDGNKRLQPRGSFSTYLQEIDGCSKAWTDSDQYLLKHLWPLLSAAQRQTFLLDLARQQTLMINELNHRVRNVFALVKSVFRQARPVGGGRESFSQAIESRIHALAAAHDIGSGAARSAVSVHKILHLELAPYRNDEEGRVRINGPEFGIRADVAPIFALVIHELVTNAAKYGALSVRAGQIEIETRAECDGMSLEWVEAGGPKVRKPNSLGFGTTLIRQSVPYEMGGDSQLDFAPDGLRAKLTLPPDVLADPFEDVGTCHPVTSFTETNCAPPPVEKTRQQLVLIVEDNFVIASDLKSELQQLGFTDIELHGRAEDTLYFVKSHIPRLAVLDFNLGRGTTSAQIAEQLRLKGVPTVFVSGYGEDIAVPDGLRDVPVLTKPVSQAELRACLETLLKN